MSVELTLSEDAWHRLETVYSRATWLIEHHGKTMQVLLTLGEFHIYKCHCGYRYCYTAEWERHGYDYGSSL